MATDCLFSVVSSINSEQADLYYSDEILIGNDGSEFTVFRKPAYNENLLFSHNYITHFVVAEAALFHGIGGLEPAMNGAQDFDLFLRLSEHAEKIVHIPEILYRWRAHDSSTSVNHGEKHYADEAGRLALQAAMKRRGIDAVIENSEWKFFYRVNRTLSKFPKVSVIIAYSQNDGFVDWLNRLLNKTAYPDPEFLLLLKEADGQVEGLTGDAVAGKVSFLEMSQEYTQATMYNLAAEKAEGEYLLFLDPAIEISTASWIEELLKQCMLPQTGLVCGRVHAYGEDECISREPDLKKRSAYYYNRFVQECSRHLNGLEFEQNVFTLACNFTMVKRMQFLQCGGFDGESFPLLFADNDLCLRLRQQGYENIYTPFAGGQWREPESDKDLDLPAVTREKEKFQQRWRKELLSGDPYYNRALAGRGEENQNHFLQWYAGENGV